MSAARPGAERLRGWLLCGAALLATPAIADDEARQWLASVHEALETRNYQGEFLHLANGRAEKLRIFHRVREGRVAERLVSLSGSGREVVRRDAELQCYLPDERKVLVETQQQVSALLGRLPNFDPALEANYHLVLAGHVRSVIGLPARILAINPRDGSATPISPSRLRFGQCQWLRLLLRSWRIAAQCR